MNHKELNIELKKPKYNGLSDEATVAKVEADAKYLLAFTTRVLPRKEVKSWLMEINKLDEILQADTDLKKRFAFILTDPDYSEIPVFDNLAQFLFASAVQAGLFTAAQKAQIEDKARTYEDVTVHDVRIARTYDTYLACLKIQNAFVAAFNNVNGELSQLVGSVADGNVQVPSREALVAQFQDAFFEQLAQPEVA